MQLVPHLRRALSRTMVVFALTSATLFVSDVALAAKVTQVKGASAMIDFSNSEFTPKEGDRYFVVVDGKRRAVVRITKVRGKRAVARVLKGKATTGASLQAASPAGSGSGGQAAGSGQAAPSSSLLPGLFIGGMVGMNMGSQSVKSTTGGVDSSASLSGSGFSAKVFGDVPIAGQLGLIGRFGAEQLGVKGTANPGNINVETSILYLSGDLLLRYRLMEGDFAPFVAAGLGLHFPMSKSSTAVIEENIAATTVFFAGGGLNYSLSPDMFITFMGEYGMFPPSNTVSTSIIAVRGGVAFRF